MTSRYCPQCGKARKACICGLVRPLSSNVELVILQHPTEEHKPLGTARILKLSLANCRCFVGEDFSDHPELNLLLNEAGVDHYVLYPSSDSLPVSPSLYSSSGAAHTIRVILLDGSWKKAYKMWQLSTSLHDLPMLRLPEGLQGNYRIRKAPKDHYLSTVEAGFHLLSQLQPEKDFTPLLETFEQMIEFQIRQMPPGLFEKNYQD